MTTADFVAAFGQAVASRRSRGARTPTGIAQQWGEFVRAVEAGYDDSIYEFDNDLSVRGLIAHLLSDPAILAHAESSWFLDSVESIDEKFRSLLTRVPIRDLEGPWWRSHLPRMAGAELAVDFHTRYGYEVERIVC